MEITNIEENTTKVNNKHACLSSINIKYSSIELINDLADYLSMLLLRIEALENCNRKLLAEIDRLNHASLIASSLDGRVSHLENIIYNVHTKKQ